LLRRHAKRPVKVLSLSLSLSQHPVTRGCSLQDCLREIGRSAAHTLCSFGPSDAGNPHDPALVRRASFAEAENSCRPHAIGMHCIRQALAPGVSKSETEAAGKTLVLIGESRHCDQRLNILIISAAAQSEVAHPCPLLPEEKVVQRWRWVGTKGWSSIRRRYRKPRPGRSPGC